MVHDRASRTELEVKVGLVFDGARPTGRRRRALVGRTLDAGTEGWTAWAERFTALCTKLGVYEADRICFVSDGAAAIRWIRERAFPTAIELLDWYHLVDQLRAAIGPDRPDRLETALALAAPGDAGRLLELLAAWAYEEAGSDLERSDKLAAAWGYVSNNRRAIENYRIVPLASSGPMEKAVDLVVARRFKARGMSWYEVRPSAWPALSRALIQVAQARMRFVFLGRALPRVSFRPHLAATPLPSAGKWHHRLLQRLAPPGMLPMPGVPRRGPARRPALSLRELVRLLLQPEISGRHSCLNHIRGDASV